jgi:uncharacterized membrane protein YphA (DoxX/SURF4 family)
MKNYSNYLFTSLRVMVGWHFLYEGIVKLMTPGWSAKMYLMGSKWIFSDIFHQMAASAGIMKVVDFLNIWGLILIGLSLFAGLLVRLSSIAGAILLLFYFVAYPPIPGYTFGAVTEGSYLWVNKTLIEFFILLVFTTLPVDFFFGFDRWIKRWKDEKAQVPVPTVKEGTSFHRREILRDLISVPVIGAFAYAAYKKKKWDSFEEKFMTGKPDANTGATLKSFQFASLADLKGELPKGKIGDIDLSRLIMGGNLIGGWAHSRDLIYVSKLVKAYHTDDRVMITLQMAEQCGINAIITNPSLGRIMNKYWHETGGKIKFISDCGVKEGFLEGIRQSQQTGASAMYCQGGDADRLIIDGKFNVIRNGLELIRSYGKPAGIGAHRLETIQACVEQGIKPDFWVKTLHEHNYWSAQVDAERKDTSEHGFRDNIFCFKPQETIDFMNGLEEPWIAFKVLAAGAIQPKDGFKYAFNGGADFICVGMYDFQIVDDTNIALDSLAKVNRTRPWRG